MSSYIHYHLFIFSLTILLLFSISDAKTKKPKPTALVFPIRKDVDSNQYYTTIEFSTPHNFKNIVIDLGGQHTWFNCGNGSDLPTYRPIRCGSKKCTSVNNFGCVGCNLPRKPGCTNNTCGVASYNPYSNDLYAQGIGEDAVYVDSVSNNGLSIGLSYHSPQPYLFSCAHPDLLRGLTNSTTGMAGLANTTTSLHTQMSTQFNLPHKFAICMPSASSYVIGQIFIGGGMYIYPPYNKDIAAELSTTPLVINPVSTAPAYTEGDPSDEYFINVKSISVDHKLIVVNSSLLSIDKQGNGGTKLSTITAYTKLETSIYKSLLNSFNKAAALKKMKRVASVAPFGACFSSKSIASSETGPVVPYIDIGLAGNSQNWRFYGANSMVSVNKDVMCLAFVDAGSKPKPRTSIVIGGYQMENYVIEFDLVSSKLGISTSLLFHNTTCSQSLLR
ncbi:putative aspartic proteinase GIP2 [Apium graveolens]|uniref:putative aspartic proteinase GIP2 n=1 Tax=Apium graveolens TaxID=4045 RepID=UPI003D7A1EEB